MSVLYRVFTCPSCNYTGYKEVSSADEESTCNLCSTTITHSPVMEYVNTADEALRAMRRMQIKSPPRPRPSARYGLGVKRRVLNIVSDLSDLNRGKGVNVGRVIQECKDAKIDLDKARKFLFQLEEEGLIIDMDGQLAPIESDDW